MANVDGVRGYTDLRQDRNDTGGNGSVPGLPSLAAPGPATKSFIGVPGWR